jgi:addiction module HigA family antidote
MPRRARPPLPGEVLLRRFLQPRDITQTALAKHIDEHLPNLNMLILGKRRITPRNAWLLGWALGTRPEYWLELQNQHDLWRSRPARPVGRIKRGSGARP